MTIDLDSLRFRCSNLFGVLACIIKPLHNNFALGSLANMFRTGLDLVREKRQSSSTFYCIHYSSIVSDSQVDFNPTYQEQQSSSGALHLK